MQTATIEELTYTIQNAEEKPIFFLGAGASKTGGIPLAGELAQAILKEYENNPRIQKLDEAGQQDYSQLMDCLTPKQRDELLKKYIDQAKVNVTHIYLAQLMKQGFVDYVLTVNFDNLMLRALALFNEFPPTYDMAILKDLTTTKLKEKAVVYLHGQHHGLWLLNTPEEMEKVKETVPRILDSIKHGRPWVFVGYSGNDPIFEHIKNLGRFDNNLYWVTHRDAEPSGHLREFLETPNTNAFLIQGFDADSFLLKLNTELGLDQPKIVDRPFSSLQEMVNNIVDIEDEEHFQDVKERLEIAKRQIREAIRKFEEGKIENLENSEESRKKSEIDQLNKEVINVMVKFSGRNDYPADQISNFEKRAEEIGNVEVNNHLGNLYYNWGNDLRDLAETKTDEDAEILYFQSFDKYRKAIEIKPELHEALNNWGNGLGRLAETKTGEEAEAFYQQAYEKYQKAVEIKPDKYGTFCNWGNSLGSLAGTKTGEEAEVFYQQAFGKYQKAVEIKPDLHDAFYGWGFYLLELARIKTDKEAKLLYQQSIQKLEKAVELGDGSYYLSCVYAVNGEKEPALSYLEKSLKAKEITADFVKKNEDWKNYLQDEEFLALLEKYA